MCSCNESKFEVINWWKMWNDISDIGWKIVHLLRWSNEYSDILYHMLHPNHSLYNDPTSPLVLELNMLIRNLIYLPLTEQVWFSRWCSYWYAKFLRKINLRYPVIGDILKVIRGLRLTLDRVAVHGSFLKYLRLQELLNLFSSKI